MHPLVEALVALLILIGAFFLIVGALGLAKLPDMMRRLHGPTKATTLGIGALLIASMVYFAALRGGPSIHELLITVFILISSPVTTMLLMRAAVFRPRD